MSVKTSINKATDTFSELFFLYTVIVLFAALGFSILEHKPFLDSVWWASVTAMTVGYGDMYPITAGGRIVGMVLMHIVPLFVVPLFIARFLGRIVEDQNAFTNEEQEEIKRTLAEIKQKLSI